MELFLQSQVLSLQELGGEVELVRESKHLECVLGADGRLYDSAGGAEDGGGLELGPAIPTLGRLGRGVAEPPSQPQQHFQDEESEFISAEPHSDGFVFGDCVREDEVHEQLETVVLDHVELKQVESFLVFREVQKHELH